MLNRSLRSSLVRAALFSAAAVSLLPGQGSRAPIAEEFERLHFRSIGPATMSGRIADLAVYEANPAVYYVGTAHGGVWKTTSNGAMYTPLFQDQGLIAVGAVTISQTNPDLVWVGTGESNNRQSTSWGDGVYKSTDGGKTFQYMGLRESRHINRIVIDRTNNDVVLVAATGPLFGPGGERGVYKTTDGGRTWKLVLSVDENTGANDLVVSATDPRTLFASTYQRRRTACCMNGGGSGSALWKSIDGGDTWTRLTSGIPAGPLGRIAVDVYRKNGNIVYAMIEGPGGGGRGGGGGAGGGGAGRGGAAADTTAGGRGGRGGAAGPTGIYRSDDAGATWRRVNAVNPRPMYFSQMRIDPNNPETIYMGGVGLHMSVDGGRSVETDAAQSTHDDVHAIWINPNNSDHILIGNDGGLAVSHDKSKTWAFLPNLPVGLFYHVSFDMETPYNVCGGMQDNYDWCGPSVSRHSRGIFNYDWFQIQGGDGFVAIPDLRDSRIIYTESQDGNITRRNKITGESKNIRPTPANVSPATPAGETFRFHWDTPLIHSPNDPGVLLVAANKVFKSTDRGDSWTAISPDLTSNAKRDDIVTMGVKGSDITIAANDGIQTWPTIVSLAESPKQAGVYYAGTDDGTVSVSRDGGKTWQNVTSKVPGFPTGAFVSEVVPSRFDAGTVYLTVDNHRLNDYATHIWVSNDFGANWRSLNGNLSGEVARTLTEDQKNRDVLYIGTETGIFLSLDRGANWRRLKANFPTVRVDEITLHPRDNSMIVATHGRALWILDHLEPIQEYAAAQAAAGDARLFTIASSLQYKTKDDRNDEFWGHQVFVGENPPADAMIQMHLKRTVGTPKLRISDAAGRAVRELTIPTDKNKAGIQTVCWDMRVEPLPPAPAAGGGRGGGGGGGGGGGRGGGANPIPGVPAPQPTPHLAMNPCAAVADSGDGGRGGGGGGGFGGGGGGGAGPYVLPGTYTVALVVDGKPVDTKPLRIIADPVVQLADLARRRYNDVATDLHDLQRRGQETANALNALYPQMTDIAAKLNNEPKVPANVQSQFESLNKEFDAVRKKFGVPIAAAAAGGRGGGGGGGGRGGGGDPDNLVARVGGLKGQVIAFWETPSASMMKQYADVKLALPKAIADANAFLAKARTVSQALKGAEITLTVPPKGK